MKKIMVIEDFIDLKSYNQPILIHAGEKGVINERGELILESGITLKGEFISNVVAPLVK